MFDEVKIEEFIRCLEEEKKIFQQLIEILKCEEKIFLLNNFSGFDELISKKKLLVDQLSLHDLKRNQVIENGNRSIEIKEITNYLEKHHQNPSNALDLWNEFIALAKILKELNYTNGLIISAHLKFNQRAFSALHCAAGNICLYGPKGQAYI